MASHWYRHCDCPRASDFSLSSSLCGLCCVSCAASAARSCATSAAAPRRKVSRHGPKWPRRPPTCACCVSGARAGREGAGRTGVCVVARGNAERPARVGGGRRAGRQCRPRPNPAVRCRPAPVSRTSTHISPGPAPLTVDYLNTVLVSARHAAAASGACPPCRSLDRAQPTGHRAATGPAANER